MIGIIVLNYNEYKDTIKFIKHIIKLDIDYFLVVVDNNSTNDSFNHLLPYKSDKCIIIQSGKNGGYSFGNNIGLQWLKNNTDVKYAIVANPDTFFDKKYVERLVDTFESNLQLGLLTGYMLNKDGSFVKNQYWKCPNYTDDIFKCFLIFNKIRSKLLKYQYKEDENIIYQVPAGSCQMIRLEAAEKAGYFDEKVFLFYEENILARRLENTGYLYGIVKDVFYYHLHSTTINKNINLIKKYKIYLESMFYYETSYNNCNRMKKILLALAMKFGLVEFIILIHIKSLWRTYVKQYFKGFRI